jgi:hypothetical protein
VIVVALKAGADWDAVRVALAGRAKVGEAPV